jgi:hypothetical protein
MVKTAIGIPREFQRTSGSLTRGARGSRRGICWRFPIADTTNFGILGPSSRTTDAARSPP